MASAPLVLQFSSSLQVSRILSDADGTQYPILVKPDPKKEMIQPLGSSSPLPVYKSNSSRLLDAVSAHVIENDFYVFFQGIDKSVKYKRSEK